jgi:PKD repeat protein/predicted nucleotidyltransferase
MKLFYIKKLIILWLLIAISFDLLAQTFEEQTGISLPGIMNGSVVWGDYDKDGDLDILVVGSNISGIFRNDNNIFTYQSTVILTAVVEGRAAWGDYDNDGYPDILLTGLISTGLVAKIYHNNANNTFTEQTSVHLAGVHYSSVSWGDYDNNGDLDILLCGDNSTGIMSKVYRNNGNNSFTEQTAIKLQGVSSGSAAWGDYDNDGFLDILLSGNKFSIIYHNNGDNTFTEQTNIGLTGVDKSTAVWGDYDNDGDLDILETGWDDSFQFISKVYINNGDNTFSEQKGIVITGVFMGSTAFADYDNDGDLDILITGNTEGSQCITKIYKNNGDNTFTEQSDIVLPGVDQSSVSWGDYDNDGDLDLLLAGLNRSNSIQLLKVYKNNILTPNSNPDVPTGLSSAWNEKGIAFSWNKSSDSETPQNAIRYNLRIGTTPGGNEVKSGQSLSDGRLLFQEISNLIHNTSITMNLPLKKYYWSVQAVDNSGLASAYGPEQTTPADTIQATKLQAVLKPNNSLLIRWKNGNGLRRVLFARISSTQPSAEPVQGVKYLAEPYFGSGDQIGSTDWYCLFNGLADSALVYGIGGNYSYDFQVIEYIEINDAPLYYRNSGIANPGIFSSSLFSESGIELKKATMGSAAFGDYDNDGYLDIIVSGYPGSAYTTNIYRNNGNNTFPEQSNINLTGIVWGSSEWGDFDGDKSLDILLTGYSGQTIAKIFRNTGNNNFTELSGITITGLESSSVAFCDYDNDGDLDIAMTGYARSEQQIYTKIYMNNGDNSFTEIPNTIPGVSSGSVRWGDFDNDGKADILVTGETSQNGIISKVYRNIGNNTFTEQTSISLKGIFNGEGKWVDYDNDGDLDIVLTGGDADLRLNKVTKIYRNNGQTGFSDQNIINSTGVLDGGIVSGDYDNDGDTDLLIGSKLYLNNNNNYFTELPTSIPVSNSNSISCGDIDNDGDLDLLIGSTVFRNNFIMKAGNFLPNRKPQAPDRLLAITEPGGTKLSWGPVKTDETPYMCMSYNIRIGTTSGKSDIVSSNSDLVTGVRFITGLGNTQLDTTFMLRSLPSGKYYWSVQAVDQAYKGGEWSTEETFVVKTVESFFAADTVCLGLPTHFTDQSVSADGIESWKWDFKNGTTSTLQNPVYKFETIGTHNVKLVIMSNEGVMDSLEKNIIVKPRALTGFNALPVCQGTPSTITNSTNSNGLSITSWHWDFADGQTSTAQQPPPHGYLNAGDYMVKLKAIAENGCADSITKTVIIGSTPIALITANAPLTFCKGDSVTLSVPQNVSYLYTWKVDGDGLTGSNTNIYVAKLSGYYTVEVVNSKGNCSTSSSQVVVNAQNAPMAPFISAWGAQQFCQGDSVNLSVTNTIGYTYQWKLNGGAVGSDQNTHVAKTAGLYSIVVSNSTGCSANSTNNINVTVNPKPDITTVSISGAQSFCQGESVTLSVTNNLAYTYQWKNNLTNISNATSSSYIAQSTGTYSLSITNANGCSYKTENVAVTTSPAPSAPAISAAGPIQFCQGDSVVLSVTQTAGYSYQWKLNGGAVGTGSNQFIAKNAGVYNIVVSNSNNCSVSSSNSVNVVVNSLPSLSAVSLSGPTQLCQGGSITMNIPSTSGYSYNWRNENGLILDANTNSYTAKKSGVYQLDISNSSGCVVKTTPVNVMVKPVPLKPAITSDNYQPGKCLGENPIRLNVGQTVSGYNYQWYKNGIPVNSTAASYLEGFLSPGDYSLEADLGGCKSLSDILYVYFENAPEKPQIYAQGPTLWYLACSNDSASAYKWYYNGILVLGADKYLYVANQKLGKYNVSISNTKGCYTLSDTITIPKGISGIDDIDPFAGLKIYPNPTPGLFTIEMDNNIFGKLEIRIFTSEGRQILNINFEKTTEQFSSQIDLSGQGKGAYLINLMLNKYLANRKIIVE